MIKQRQSKLHSNGVLFTIVTMLLVLSLIFLFLFNLLPGFTTQGEFQVSSAKSYIVKEHILIDADMNMKFSEEVAEALENGIPLTIKVEVQVLRERFFWRDRMVKESLQLFELHYHPLTDIHEVVNIATEERYSFHSRQDAMAVLGTIRGAVLMNKKRLTKSHQYHIRMRTSLDISRLPLALRQIASLSSSWHLESPWFVWAIDLNDRDNGDSQ